MLSVGVIVSHRSTKLQRFPDTTRAKLDSAIGELNHSYKKSGLASVEVAFDYEGFRIFDTPENTQDRIVERMLALREQFDILIFCPLIDGEFGSGMKLEYDAIRQANNTLPLENKIYIECFIRIKEGISDSSYPELLDKSNTSSQVCNWYIDDRDFKSVVKDTIHGIILSYPKKDKEPPEASSEEPKNIKEPSTDNSNDKQPEEGATNRGRGHGWYFGIIILILLTILSLLFWKRCSSTSNPEGSLVPTVTQIDSAREIINKRVSIAETLVQQGLFEAAKDSLKAIKKDCQPEWDDVLLKINTLESLIPTPPAPPKASDKKRKEEIPQPGEVTIEDSTFEIYGVENPFRAGIVSAILEEMPSLEKPSDNKKEQWSIRIEINPEFTEVPKEIESDEYMIDIEYSISVKDNIAGKTVFENTFPKRGRSPASLEDAKKHSRQLAAKEIAQQVKQFIQ